MSQNIAIRPTFYFQPNAGAVSDGYGMAQDAWFSTAEGKSNEQAATDLTKSLMSTIINMSPEQAAVEIYSAALFLLEIAHHPTLKDAA